MSPNSHKESNRQIRLSLKLCENKCKIQGRKKKSNSNKAGMKEARMREGRETKMIRAHERK